MKRLILLGWLLPILAGCAQMKVTKVTPVCEGDTSRDCVKGFRYYLSRPYVMVKEKIVVTSETSLVVVSTEDRDFESIKGAIGAADKMTRFDATKNSLEQLNQDQRNQLRDALSQSLPGGATLDGAGRLSVPIATGAGDAVYRSDAAGATQGAQAKSLGSDMTQAADVKDGGKTVDLNGKIDVVFLPDFDEQYAVHNCNFLAKSTYSLAFKDGWQLLGVNGKFDSTTVAIAFLDTIDSAVNTAQTVASAGLDTAAKVAAAKAKTMDLLDATVGQKDGQKAKFVVLQVKHERVIVPGLYRINKPWEVEEGPPVAGVGLLAKMGFPIVDTYSIDRADVTAR